jgi:tetratricopeptide (TPR) repeat protein
LLLAAGARGRLEAQVVSSGSVLDDAYVREEGLRGLDAIYSLRFSDAADAFGNIDRRYPDHPIGPFLQSLTTWWEILLDLNDTSQDEEFYAMMDRVVERCDRMLDRDEHDPDAMFFKGAALGFRGRLRSNREQWFRAAMDGKRAMGYVLSVADRDSTNADYMFGKGIYDYFAEVIPERYAAVRPLMAFFPNGDRERGLAILERTARDGHFVRTEAVYFLFHINFAYERDYDAALEYVEWLLDRYPENAYFHAMHGRVFINQGRWQDAREVYQEVLARYVEETRGYGDAIAEQALYYLARTEMARAEFEAALGYLLQLEALAARIDADTPLKVLGRLRQGMSHDALGHRETALDRYREVLDMDDASGAHERARRYLETPYRSGRR